MHVCQQLLLFANKHMLFFRDRAQFDPFGRYIQCVKQYRCNSIKKRFPEYDATILANYSKTDKLWK